MKKKIISLFLLLTLILSVIPFSSYAQFEIQVTKDDVKSWIKNNYWVNLKADDLNAVPIGVNPRTESRLGNDIKDEDLFGPFFIDLFYPWPNTGIRTDRAALFDTFGVDTSDDMKNLMQIAINRTNNREIDSNIWKDLGFDLENDTIKNVSDFDIYGDIYKADNNDSSQIGLFKTGEKLDLDLKVDLTVLKKSGNTTIVKEICSYSKTNKITQPNNGFFREDDKFAFTIEIPKEAIVDDSLKFEIDGLPSYKLDYKLLGEDDISKKFIVYAYSKDLKPVKTLREFYTELNAWDPNVTLKVRGLRISRNAQNNKNYTIKASIAGMYDQIETNIKDLAENLTGKGIKFDMESDIYQRIRVVFAAKQSNEGRDAAADKDKPNLISYTFNVEERKASHNPVVTFINDDRYYDEREVIEGTSINQNSNMPRDPEKRGYKFIEWNTRPDGSGMSFTGDTVVYEDMTVYAIYKKDRRYDDESETADEEPMLNINDHYQYMVGYKDATFRPNNNMTREEVAVMFSRLMVRRPIKGHIYNHNFKDLSNTRWSATAISYMNELGLIKGYPDGTFKPEKSITRAEFAAMATRFANLFGGGLQGFVDVPYTHWANDVIAKAASAGWVSGYPDGTFKPENKITRAEVVSITNRMLTRRADKDFITKHRSAILWFTDTPTHWAFYDIVEACNGHDYTRQGTIEENWLNVNLKTFVYDK